MNMLIVKKFGGTSVADKDRIFNVAKRCIRDYEAGNDVVVVLSAMGKYTDELIAKAKDINPNPPKREMDMLFTIGEQMSVSLMAMAMACLLYTSSSAGKMRPGLDNKRDMILYSVAVRRISSPRTYNFFSSVFSVSS